MQPIAGIRSQFLDQGIEARADILRKNSWRLGENFPSLQLFCNYFSYTDRFKTPTKGKLR